METFSLPTYFQSCMKLRLCWSWHSGYLGRLLAEVCAVCSPPILMRADGFDRLRDTCQTCWKWFFCFVTCWIHRRVVSKICVHKTNTEPATNLTSWREAPYGIAAPLSRVPPALTLHQLPPRTAWSLSRSLAKARRVGAIGVMPCTPSPLERMLLTSHLCGDV